MYTMRVMAEILEPIAKGDNIGDKLVAQLKQAKLEEANDPPDVLFARGHVTLLGLQADSIKERIRQRISVIDARVEKMAEENKDDFEFNNTEAIEQLLDFKVQPLPDYGRLILQDPHDIMKEVQTPEDLERLSQLVEQHVDHLDEHVSRIVLPSVSAAKSAADSEFAKLDNYI